VKTPTFPIRLAVMAEALLTIEAAKSAPGILNGREVVVEGLLEGFGELRTPPPLRYTGS